MLAAALGVFLVGAAPPSADGSVELALGQTATLSGVEVRAVRMVQDSRCPPDVACFWAGAAIAEIEVKADGSRETVHLGVSAGKPVHLAAPPPPNTVPPLQPGGAPVAGGRWVLAVRRVTPGPSTKLLGGKIAPGDYRLLVALEPAAAPTR